MASSSSRHKHPDRSAMRLRTGLLIMRVDDFTAFYRQDVERGVTRGRQPNKPRPF